MRGICQGIVTNLTDFMHPDDLKLRKIKTMIGTGSALTRNPVLQEELRRIYGVDLNIKTGDAANGVALYFVRKGRGPSGYN